MAEAPQTRPSLLVRIRDPGDGMAWSEFVGLYAPLIYGLARKKGLQDADAADLTQDVLRAVAGAVRRFHYDPYAGSFRGWLFTIVRNKLRNFLSRQSRRAQGSGDTQTLQRLNEQPAAADEDEWDAEHDRRLFAWAVEQVRPAVAQSTWQAFWQTAVEGRPATEVARGLGLAVAAVYMARSRLLARLRDLVRQTLGEDNHV
jgi:RNA polymerase sigma-70 factor (ECF subfamily)